ncbi:MAG: hypothetical protein WCA35_11990 [Kovacikia sp.]
MRWVRMANRIGQMKWVKWMVLGVLCSAAPAFGETSNFGTLTLSADKTIGSLSGTTGGATSLPAIVSSGDIHNNPCLGFGDPTPDHILVLQQSLPKLKLQVNSSNSDTTLVIQGADGSVRCGDNIGSKKDASMVDTNWAAGSYKVWVGTINPGVRRNYTLTVRQMK